MSRIAKAAVAKEAAEKEFNEAKVEFVERFASYKVGDTIKGYRIGNIHRIPCEFKVLDRHVSVDEKKVVIIYCGFVRVGRVGSKAARFEEAFSLSGIRVGSIFEGLFP